MASKDDLAAVESYLQWGDYNIPIELTVVHYAAAIAGAVIGGGCCGGIDVVFTFPVFAVVVVGFVVVV